MKKLFLILWLLVSGLSYSHALIINEIMSNPIGDDGGREWIEVYNNSSSTIDLSGLTISIKGAAFTAVTSVSGSSILSPDGYAIIGSVVAGVTKFLQDYPSYSGLLFRGSMSLVNTGVTSLEIKLGGQSMDTLSSYTAAKEGLTLSRINGSFAIGNPTPGAENQPIAEDTSTQATSTSNVTNTQATIAQASAPIADIVLYMPTEKVTVAGAESTFSIFGLTRGGKAIDNLSYTWAYGDGGQSTGSTTLYRYAYPGKYIIQVEGTNGYIAGTGRMSVRVVAPDILIKSISTGKYGAYIDIENPNTYDLDFSQWRLTIDGASFPFPKNTLIAGNSVTHLSGLAMGFASTTISSNTIIKILFPNQEEVTRYSSPRELFPVLTFLQATSTVIVSSTTQPITVKTTVGIIKSKPIARVLGVSTSTLKNGSVSKGVILPQKGNQKDTRIVAFFKSLFSRK